MTMVIQLNNNSTTLIITKDSCLLTINCAALIQHNVTLPPFMYVVNHDFS